MQEGDGEDGMDHEGMDMGGDVMTMVPQESVEIPTGGTVNFEPGGTMKKQTQTT